MEELPAWSYIKIIREYGISIYREERTDQNGTHVHEYIKYAGDIYYIHETIDRDIHILAQMNIMYARGYINEQLNKAINQTM